MDKNSVVILKFPSWYLFNDLTDEKSRSLAKIVISPSPQPLLRGDRFKCVQRLNQGCVERREDSKHKTVDSCEHTPRSTKQASPFCFTFPLSAKRSLGARGDVSAQHSNLK